MMRRVPLPSLLLLLLLWALPAERMGILETPYGVRDNMEDVFCTADRPGNRSCHHPDAVEEYTSANVRVLFRRLRTERGLRRITLALESLVFPLGLPKSCRSVTDVNKSAAPGSPPKVVCLQPRHLALPDRWVTFAEFLRAGGLDGRTCGPVPFSRMCPFLDGRAFKLLADKVWETFSYVFRGSTSFNISTMHNRSLVYWNLGVYPGKTGSDLNKLHALLPRIQQHFFIIHHNTDCPRFPPWLLNSPKVLKIFAAYVPEGITHPKVIPIPLGLKPIGLGEDLRAVRHNFTDDPPTQDLVMSGLSLGRPKVKTTRRMDRAGNRRYFIKAIGPRFNVSMHNATHHNFSSSIEYFLTIRHHRFVLSLPGTGLDAYRTWEVLYIGRVPVVSHWLNPWLFHQLPVLRVPLQRVDAALLREAWRNLSLSARRYNVGRLSLQWWVARILVECLMTP
eukprot:GGOE01044743.1.p1 GENE.GGOE01044743.1~~GGOE01044743.1.p1  ORF type:complete len:449 (-),score=116.69 GGOE01044743.1:85-1431(-)